VPVSAEGGLGEVVGVGRRSCLKVARPPIGRYRQAVNPRSIEAEERERVDAQLLHQVRNGDAQALGSLVSRYWVALVSYVARFRGDWDAAQDAAQETFVRLWERRERWTAQGSVRALLYQIAHNVASNDRQREDSRARLLETHGVERKPPTPADELRGAEVQQAFREALAALPRRRREVFVLARFEGLTHRQIGSVLGISAQTVANQLSAALAELRQRLGGLLETPAPTDQHAHDGRVRSQPR